jgi:hypothetical protein
LIEATGGETHLFFSLFFIENEYKQTKGGDVHFGSCRMFCVMEKDLGTDFSYFSGVLDFLGVC